MYSSSQGCYTATGTHMPHGITQRWHSRPYPSRSWYSIKRPRRDARLMYQSGWQSDVNVTDALSSGCNVQCNLHGGISNKIEPVSSRKCPYDHWLTNKAYSSAVTVTNISWSFYLQAGGKNQLAQIWNKITSLSLCVYTVLHKKYPSTFLLVTRIFVVGF